MEQEHMIRPYDTDMLAFSLANQGIEGLRGAILWINEEKNTPPLGHGAVRHWCVEVAA